MKQRIWELDALRGLCILGMVGFHLLYDMTDLFGLVSWELPSWLGLIGDLGARVFLVLSGICVTLGSRPVRRGMTVLGCGLLCWAVTAALYQLGLADRTIVIRFGMLHCLGLCMLLWPLLRRLPKWAQALLGTAIILLGFWLDQSNVRVQAQWLYPLGLRYPGFSSGDYYPLAPGLGWFLMGAVLGGTVYQKKESLLPGLSGLPFLQLCGRHSLAIYLLHQPILIGLLAVLQTL